MLLSAVSVLVVAQSISEIPEGLMNNPVLEGEFLNKICACERNDSLWQKNEYLGPYTYLDTRER